MAPGGDGAQPAAAGGNGEAVYDPVLPPAMLLLAEFTEGADGRVFPATDSPEHARLVLAEATKLDGKIALQAADELKRRYHPDFLAQHKIRPGEMVIELPLNLIDRNPWQTRTTLEDDPRLLDLVESIKQQGVMQPVVVRPLKQPGHSGQLYHLIAGERRWLASKRAGKTHIPAIVRNIPDQQVAVLTIVENLHREDLNPMQHARAFEGLSRDFGLTQDEVAQRCAIPRSVVANYLRLTRLPEEVQKAIEEGRLSFGHAKALLPMSTGMISPEMVAMARKVMAQRLSVRETEALVEEWLHPLPKEPRPERKVDPNVRAAERELENALGCRVKITDRGLKGKIVIEYKSLEDFDRVMQALK
ncbi:MAG: ParB/RepB/Spo0J family partition protein [Terriglobales bacterium]